MTTSTKIYLKVIAVFAEDGKILPKSLVWEDGRQYTIDRIVDIQPRAALKAGGQGDRYTIQINGQRRYLFFERNTGNIVANLGRWFVEGKN